MLTKMAQKRLACHYLITKKQMHKLTWRFIPSAGANHDKSGPMGLGIVWNISGNEASGQNCEQIVSKL